VEAKIAFAETVNIDFLSTKPFSNI